MVVLSVAMISGMFPDNDIKPTYWTEQIYSALRVPEYPISGLLFTDLDGTLIQKGSSLQKSDEFFLKTIGKAGWMRAIVTGRSLDSFHRVFPVFEDLPFDYVIFSSGAGIIETATEKLVRTVNLTGDALEKILAVLNQEQLDYMLHDPAPKNTPFHWWSFGRHNPDFHRRIELYQAVCSPLSTAPDTWHKPAAQVIVISPPEEFSSRHYLLKDKLRDFTVVRTTSPLDGRSVWHEIYPNIVSKGQVCEWLRQKLGLNELPSIAIGNDYNDWDMLTWADAAYVVPDAPEELSRKFLQTPKRNLPPVASVIHDVLASGGYDLQLDDL